MHARSAATGLSRIEAHFAQLGWTPFDFQRQVWAAFRAGESGLVHAPTGMGKTHAAWFGPVSEMLDDRIDPRGLRVLWITPMRALATDTERALSESAAALGLDIRIEKRTGDTSSSVRARQKKQMPTALVTTPESLSLLLSYADAESTFRNVRAVIVDEWHELLASKRGIQTELCLARLRRLSPGLRTWGLSATIGNLEEATAVLLGGDDAGVIVRGDDERVGEKVLEVETILPDDIERFPWYGHLGLTMLPRVLERVEAVDGVTLIFTNTRSQVELWYRSIMTTRPEWLGEVAVHHGSLDLQVRREVEAGIRSERFRIVVCTSSLDLGVDFSPVRQVMQVGSPKGIARLMQRAGRSGHQPGAVSRVICVPSHAMELVEFAAARRGIEARDVESREPLHRPLDVLVQHLVTVGIGAGFSADDMRDEVRSAWSYRDLTDEQWGWCMDFVERGGSALRAYPQYARLVEKKGLWRGATPSIARTHRLGIGTIGGAMTMQVRFGSGKVLGTIEEGFIARLRIGDCFNFGGRLVELVRIDGMSAVVRVARKKVRGAVPRWAGGKSPLSTRLAAAVRQQLTEWLDAESQEPEISAVAPLLELQRQLSVVPRPDELLIETAIIDRAHHTFIFPFEGRLVHEGLGALLAHRIAQRSPATINIVVSDYGIELTSASDLELDEAAWRELLIEDHLPEDLLACLDATQLARRRFRDIARIAGLILPTYPGERRRARHLQASSDMFFDVLNDFDAGNLLLEQSRREVLEQELEVRRLRTVLKRLSEMKLILESPGGLTPFAFPLYAETLRAVHVSTEAWDKRIRRIAEELEQRIAET